MISRTPDQIQRWLDANLHRFDLPAQYLGDEPNAVRRDWAAATVRLLMAASWPYEHGAGNQAIPAVCQSVCDASPDYLAERSYLPATARDMRLLEKGGIPVFGIESKHAMGDYDVAGTSISYLVLLMSFARQLTMSGIPMRWRDRERLGPESFPMIMIGGQAYSAPGAMEPVADCLWLGEVEDEPGNGGIGQVFARIAEFKADGLWQSGRLECYRRLAREFRYLHFPRFVQTFYRYEDRGLEHPSKQVSGYCSLLEDMPLPRRARKVADMDAIRPLRSAPLLYADPALGAGDLEVARGCPAWCSFCRLSWVTKPYRQRSVAASVRHAEQWHRDMGAVELSPFSPDFPMHTQKKRLIAELLQINDEADSVAMRVDDFIADGDYIMLQALGGMDAVTLGLEGNCLHHSTRIQVPGVGLLSLGEMAADQRRLKMVKVGREDAELEGVSCSGTRQVWRVTLSDGSQLLATPEHLIRTLDGAPAQGRIYLTPDQRRQYGTTSNYLSKRLQADALGEVWREVRDLRPGMVLRSYYGQMRWPDDQAGNMGEDMAWLLGNLSGDGRVTPAGIEVRCDNPGVRERVTGILARLGVQTCVRLEEGRSPIVTAYRRELAAVLAGFGVLDTDTKRHVPHYVWRSPWEVVAAYLRGVLDADGCVPERGQKHGLTVVHGTHSEEFARDLGQLISAFGHPVSLQRNVNADGYVMWHTVIHSAPDADWSWLRFSETSRQLALEAALRRSGSRLGQVQWRGGQDGVKYVTVRSVEPDAGMARVYDLHVPGVVSFTANNVVVHNSQRMRDLVGKGASDQEVIEAVTRGIRAGIRKFKLFMITNLPGETPGDVLRIVRLARRLAEIRSEMGQPNIRIQFSWTPLLIEAGTPFQWFAPTPPDHTLIQVSELFRELKVELKIGTKAEPNKVAFFQLCQRASAEVGEAVIDVLADLDTACWGGVPRDMRDRLEAALIARGFLNGFGDCFDERGRGDLFGWEYIDTGVSRDLLWVTYQQMVEFLENTDAEAYDDAFDEHYHGNEWVARCDVACQGKSCGACEPKDLKLRTAYIRAAQSELDVDLNQIRPVDQSSVALRLRARLVRPERLRFVANDHWRFAVRRAAYRAQHVLGSDCSVAKRTIRFASDAFTYRDWTCGTDYVEFGLTRRLSRDQAALYADAMRRELAPWLALEEHDVRLPSASLRRDSSVCLNEIEVRDDIDTVRARLRAWDEADSVRLVLKSETSFFGLGSEEVSAKDYAEDLWLAVSDSRPVLRFYTRRQASPYQIVAALMGRPSWIEAAALPARRLDFFTAGMTGPEAAQGGLLTPSCAGCGLTIPESLLERPWDPDYCPRCRDEAAGAVLAGAARSLPV